MSAEPNTKTGAAAALDAEHAMLEALMAGTGAMRAKGKAYLPQWPAEDDAAYKARCDTATLFPAYHRTVSVMVGKPFGKPITYGDDVPPRIKEWCEDIDLQGVNLQAFAAEMFGESFYGLAGILVESPKIEAARTLTRAEQTQANIRPYFVRVMHDQLLGWRTATRNGVTTLTQLRIKECATEPDGDYGEKKVERVRVLEPGQFRVLEKREGVNGKADWVPVESGKTALNKITFVPTYGFRKAFMCGVPPLLDLAYLNVKHWQSQSDQDTILHYARVPILAIIGADEQTTLALGGSTAAKVPAGGDIKWVEHSGAAIGAGQTSIEALEDQMIQAGAELLVKKPGQRSATEAANDADANKSDLQRMAEAFEDALDQALQFMAEYAGMPSGGHVSLFKDFGAANLSEASGQLVLAMEQAGLISSKTAINEMKRRGELAAEVDHDEEQELIAEQGPALGTITDVPSEPAPAPVSDQQLDAAA